VVLSIKKRVFLVEYVFREGSAHTDLVQEQSAEKLPDFYLRGAAKSAVYHDRPRTPHALKTAITAYIRNISQSHLQKVFANKIKRVQTCIDAPTGFMSG
jgi:hypothetical protein